MAELPAGARFAGHEIRGVAGRGAMGVVYRALDPRGERPVALKVIGAEQSKDTEFRIRFGRECEVAASLRHPNLVPVYASGEEDGCLYLTMRLVDGLDLARLIARDGPLDPARAAEIVAQVADALDAAHDYGVVHRDVKPANVLLEGDRALLTDFGLQRDLRAKVRVTEPGTLIGTFDYTAPEQLQDAGVDARADVYALGCVLYEALTGEVPFPRAHAAAKIYAHLGAPPPSPRERRPDVPAALDLVVRTALAKSPEDRHPSAGALGAAALAAAGPFVGRTHELAAIARHYQAGERRVVLIEGEPGIGKTRLALEAACAAPVPVTILDPAEPAQLTNASGLVLAVAEDGADLARHAHARIRLTGLGREDLTALGGPADLYERTEGNPLYVHALLRGQRERITERIRRRLAALDEDARRTLAAAAALGREFRLDVLEAAGHPGALDAIEAACAAGLVREGEEVDRYGFAPFVRETIAAMPRPAGGARRQSSDATPT